MVEKVNDPYLKICRYDVCAKSFKAKRLNQEYCCPGCKKKANNGEAAKERLIIKRIDDILKRNRKILDDIYRKGITIIDFHTLHSSGFDLSKHTGRRQDGNGNYIIPEFYNYALIKINDKQFKIEKLW